MAAIPPPTSTTSFWHSEPSAFLLNHHTTPTLPLEADIVIIGSGITGASAARFIAEDARAEHLSVVMLDAREACWCATGRNGGHCQPLLFDSTPDVAAFELRNCSNVRSYIRDHDVECEWRDVAGCRTFWTEQLARAAREDVEGLKRDAPVLGKEVQVIESEEEMRKYRVNGASGATLTSGAGSLWPYKLVAFVLEKLIRGGKLNLQTMTPVTRIETCVDTDGTVGDGARRQVLHTPQGTIKARHVILATNGYTAHLLPEFSDLIVPERGNMTALLPPARSERLETSYGFVGAFGGNPIHDDYLNQRPFSGVPNPAGHLMFGGGYAGRKLNAIGETDDSIVDEGAITYLKKALLKLLNLGGESGGLEELEAAYQWSGIWGTSRDHHPWVGAVPGRRGVWLAGGYSGHGMPNATLCGKAVVEMLLAQDGGVAVEDVQDKLVDEGNLPQAYVITKERMERCKDIDSVQVQDQKGRVGIRSIDKMMRAQKREI